MGRKTNNQASMCRSLIITGASRGIGLTTARKFCDAGYKVVNLSRSPAFDATINSQAVDLTDTDLTTIVEGIATHVEEGEVSIIHNAAFMTKDTVYSSEGVEAIQAFQRTMHVNVVAPQIINQVRA